MTNLSKSKKQNIFKYFFIIVVLMVFVFYLFNDKDKISNEEMIVENNNIAANTREEVNEEVNIEPTDDVTQENKNVETEKFEDSKNIPDEIFIKVPFTSQAPFANWDQYHEEACEEASVIMLKYYLDGKTLNKNIAEKEIQAMIKFEIKKYGDYKDTNAQETAKLAADFYGIKNLKVIYDFKVEEIKKYLAKNKPIIVPAAGRALGNPNFTPPGPRYHNLVLIGYDGDTIITNDPGTRKGEGYRYNINILYNAIHDFPGKPENIGKGRKAMIVLE